MATFTNEKFYELFNSRVFGGTLDTVEKLRELEKLQLIELSEFQNLKLNEYFDRAFFGRSVVSYMEVAV